MKYSTLLIAVLLATPAPARADLFLKNFTHTVTGSTVAYEMEACDSGTTGGSSTTTVGLYYDPTSAPVVGSSPDQSQSVYPTGMCKKTTITRTAAPVGLYKSYAMIDPAGKVYESNENNNVAGPTTVCVGPDVVVKTFTIEKSGASVTYKAKVCNIGSQTATKFRVGFWHNRTTAPASTDMGDIFKSITSLAAGKCEDLTVSGGLRPNGSFTAYARADSGDFVVECREANNPNGPLAYGMANPDLVITSFTAKVTGSTVTYTVRVCNKGVVSVSKFYVDLYYHKPKQSPIMGEPGDVVQSLGSLAASACTTLTFQRTGVPDGTYASYAMADADNFVSEPNEANNLTSALSVQVGKGSGTGTGTCVDADGDGYGTGSGCSGIPDCNDNNKQIYPGVKEICGDKIDQDCDLTPDDGCPGVDCVDKDGDSFGVGKDCVLADCDDNNKLVYPWAQETCGDGKDNNCNKIIDDSCPGTNCTDADMDGHGVGTGCTGIPDCDDNDSKIHPKVKEICGDKIDNDCDMTPDDGCPGVDCVDKDGDSFGVGKDCVLADCDDNNAKVHPWAKEVCGDNKDDNCNKIADDGCTGRQCVDRDADGYGVGKGCPGPQDCKDDKFTINPGAKEVCGDGADNDCDGVTDDGCPGSKDNDGDGHSVGGGVSSQPDCNDNDAKINPDAKEICGDQIDNDCDFTVDDGCPGVNCQDSDGDSWGVGTACKVSDCNDGDSTIYPYAAEVCGDGKDNNCNGTIDEGCTGVSCNDGDGDTFGKGTHCCNDPLTKAKCKQDCDDNDGGTHPWATEICADSKDNNCNGSVDEGCTLCEDKDSDGYGIGPKCSNWDCDEADALAYPGAPEVCNGKDDNCNGVTDDDCSGGDEGCECALSPAAPARSANDLLPLTWLFLGLLVMGAVLRRRRR